MSEKKRMTLRAINDEIERIVFDTPYHEDSESEIESELKALNLQFDEKLENIGYVRLEIKARVKMLDEEIKRLTAEKVRIQARGTWLDFYVMAEMLRLGIRAFKGKFVKFAIRKSPVSAEITSIDDIDPDFIEEVITRKVKKSEAIQFFKQRGEAPAGFRFIDDQEHLRIS